MKKVKIKLLLGECILNVYTDMSSDKYVNKVVHQGEEVIIAADALRSLDSMNISYEKLEQLRNAPDEKANK